MENTAKPFKKVTEEFKAIEIYDGIFGADQDDLEEEKVIVTNDFDGGGGGRGRRCGPRLCLDRKCLKDKICV